MLGRIHRWDDVARAAEWARGAGFDNYNFDLMYALPGQTMADFEESLAHTLALDPAHISCYSRILEEGTPLTRRVEAGELTEPDDDAAVDMQRLAAKLARGAGMHRYEISNYALEGRECRHNIVYWTRGDYLGLGCAAHSLMRGRRFSNPSFDEYMRGVRHVDDEVISVESAMEETVMLETRMTRGIQLSNFEREFGHARLSLLLEEAKALEARGLLTLKNGFLSLTDEGLDVQNAVVLRLISALEVKGK